jgi:hypothetical protein
MANLKPIGKSEEEFKKKQMPVVRTTVIISILNLVLKIVQRSYSRKEISSPIKFNTWLQEKSKGV